MSSTKGVCGLNVKIARVLERLTYFRVTRVDYRGSVKLVAPLHPYISTYLGVTPKTKGINAMLVR